MNRYTIGLALLAAACAKEVPVPVVVRPTDPVAAECQRKVEDVQPLAERDYEGTDAMRAYTAAVNERQRLAVDYRKCQLWARAQR